MRFVHDEGALPGGERDAHDTVLNAIGGEDRDPPDLAGMGAVGPAARLDVEPFDLHDP